MNFIIQIDNTITEDTIILRACSRNKNYIYNVILYLQKTVHELKYMMNCIIFTLSPVTRYIIENIDHKVYIYTEKDVYRCYLRFSELKKQLHNCGFCQINQSTLVNSIHIKSVRIEKTATEHNSG
ncbi:MAG: LytTR family DNA-binding domain-containing protein [Clostridium sp.]